MFYFYQNHIPSLYYSDIVIALLIPNTERSPTLITNSNSQRGLEISNSKKPSISIGGDK